MFSASWPFIKLTVFDERIEIQRPSLSGISTSTYTWDEIHSVRRLRIMPLIAEGVYIAPKHEDWFVFWCLSKSTSSKIVQVCQDRGVKITESLPQSIFLLSVLIWIGILVPLIVILAGCMTGFWFE